MPTRCKYCERPIDWVRTPQGKKMPLDLDELSSAEAPPGTVMVLPTGQVVRVTHGMSEVKGRISHFATCPIPIAERIRMENRGFK
jgi:hypothetical protein